MTLTGIELETRRRLLGLSQQDLGLCMAVIAPRDDVPRPVSQNTISKWEEGRGGLPLPGWVAKTMPLILDRIARMQEALDERAMEYLESLEPDDGDVVHVPAYRSYQAFWKAAPRLKGWPYAMWNTALVHAVDAIDDGRDYMLDAVR